MSRVAKIKSVGRRIFPVVVSCGRVREKRSVNNSLIVYTQIEIKSNYGKLFKFYIQLA